MQAFCSLFNLFAFCYLFFITFFTDRGFGGKEKKSYGKPEPAVFATEDGGHETLKAAAVIFLGVVIFPAIVPVPATASPSGIADTSASESTRWPFFLFYFFTYQTIR